MGVGGSDAQLDDVLKFCRAHNITVGGFSSLSHGCMSKPLVSTIAASHNRSAAQVCLRWVSQLGCNVVVSSSRAEYDRSDLGSLDFDLTAAEMASLSALRGAPQSTSAHRLLSWRTWYQRKRNPAGGRARLSDTGPSPSPSPPPGPAAGTANGGEQAQFDEFGCPITRGSHSCDV
eukprot:5671196-Prymnesium_polylepis.1